MSTNNSINEIDITDITSNISSTNTNNALATSEVTKLLTTLSSPATAPANISVTPTKNVDTTIKNRLLIELQNLSSVVCHKAINQKEIKADELITKIYNQLFSISTRIGFVEQLVRGEGHFMNLFNYIPNENHIINNSSPNTIPYRLKIKQILLGNNMRPWYINELFTPTLLYYSSTCSSSKIAPKTFFYSSYKVTELKRICV